MDIGIIAFLVTLVVVGLGTFGKERRRKETPKRPLPTPKGKTAEERERKRQGDEDLITMILPTINNDGK